MKLPYIASDLDGTIVKNLDFKILDETCVDINCYQTKSNNKFFIVTGRAYQNIKYYIKQLNVTLPIITANGGAIVDPITEKVWYEYNIEKEISIKILNYCKDNDIDVTLCTATDVCCLKTCERLKVYEKLFIDYEEKFKPKFILYNNVEEIINDVQVDKYNAVKFLLSVDINDEEKVKVIDKFLTENNLYHPITKIQSRMLIDATPENVNKFFGIKKWAEIMSVNLDNIHVVGDNNNDLEMVKGMKYGIAVGNAVDDLKNVASTIIDSIDDNGVGKYLKKLINKE